MKVLDLCCATGHAFEGWFASEDDYRGQLERGLLDCPVCGNADITRRPSAPRLNLSGARAPAAEIRARAAPDAGKDVSTTVLGGPVARLAEAVAEILRQTEDVGERFAEEARRIHYGEVESKAIRGQATHAEREALADEGIEVFSLPVSLPAKNSLQ